MFKRVFAISRWFHRYLGLLLFAYLMVEGVTGVLLNHPRWIAPWSAPRWLVPPSYRVEDWNRGSLRTMVFSKKEPSLGFLAGTEGVWKTTDGGITFQPMTSGYPASRADRRTNHLLMLEGDAPTRLLAATRRGLHVCTLDNERWAPVALGQEAEDVRKVLLVGDQLIAFTASHAYVSAAGGELEFQPAALVRAGGNDQQASAALPLVKLVFALHSGEIWGLPGRLLMDGVGLALMFLSASAIYVWYFPRSKHWFPRKRNSAAGGEERRRRVFQWLWRYHIDIGVWATAFLIVVAVTALLMPPSPLVFLATRTVVSRQFWPGPLPRDPWHESIGNAAYDAANHEIVVESAGALWRGPADLTGAFVKDASSPRSSGMGVNVLEFTGDGGLLIGSFSGLYECRPSGGPVIDLRTGKPRVSGPTRRDAKGWKVAGYFETASGERFAVLHDEGIVGIGGAEPNGRFSMPSAMTLGYRMPLWSFLFELHNGRIVRDWTGSAYYLIPVLGAAGLLLICVSGLYDWAFRKLSARQAECASAPDQAAPETSTEWEPAEETGPVPVETGGGG